LAHLFVLDVLALINKPLDFVTILTAGTTSTPRDALSTNALDNNVTSYAAFGQVVYPLGDKIRMTGGLRYTKDEKKNNYTLVNQATGYESALMSYKTDTGATTYKVGIELDVAKDNMLYATIANGYKGGGVVNAIPPYKYKPEKLLSYSIGSKNRFMNNRLQMNAEAFYYDYENYQVQYAFDDVSTGNIAMYTTNAATATNYGMA